MIRLSLIIIFGFITCTSFCQKKELKKALKEGKAGGMVYESYFKNLTSKSKIENWCRKNNYVLIYTRDGEVSRFGETNKGIAVAGFVTKSDYKILQAQERERQRIIAEARSKARKKENETLAATVVGVGAIIYGGINWVKDKMGSIDYDDSYMDDYSNCELELGDRESPDLGTGGYLSDQWDLICNGTKDGTIVRYKESGRYCLRGWMFDDCFDSLSKAFQFAKEKN